MVRVDGRGDGNSLVRVRGLDKKYQRGSEEIHVLQGLNLDVDAGDFVAFMGPSGSGKTTLLNLLGGLDLPSAGSITVAGDEITHMSAGKLTAWRARHVGFIFQMYNLIPVLTAFQNVELPLLLDQALEGASAASTWRRRSQVVGLGRPHAPLSRASSPAGRSSASASRAPSSPTPRSCSATSPPATSTARAPTRSWTCSSRLVQRAPARRCCWSPTIPLAAERAQVVLHLDKGVLVEGRAAEAADEVPPPHLRQPLAQEDPHHADGRLVRGRAVPVRPAGRGPRRLQSGSGSRRRRPAGRDQQGLDHPAAADLLQGAAAADSRRQGR